MIYVYVCRNCRHIVDVVKGCKEIDQKEVCQNCENRLERILQPGYFNVKSFEVHRSSAFGKVIHSHRELKNIIAEHNDKHGTDIQEVGNDKMTTVKRQRKEYTVDGYNL